MKQKFLIGWREWVGLPDLGLPLVKAKIDTGARTSCLHAFSIEPFRECGAPWVKFAIHPIHRRRHIVQDCVAAVTDRRHVTDSGGDKELRYVIHTHLTLGDYAWPIEITLNNRESMLFGMLLGRKAIEGKAIIDPHASFLLGKPTYMDLNYYYTSHL